jgi:hypothetical protein
MGEIMRDNVTLVTCSYNTPEVTLKMLASFSKYHPDCKHVYISENSTNTKTTDLLDKYSIPYVCRPGSTHTDAVDEILPKVKTKYALLVDTDIIFYKNVEPIYQIMRRHNVAALGETCADRGGYHLHTRIHPWFMWIDIEQINRHGIRFKDQKRIIETGSEKFYGNNPLMLENDGRTKYDVGSTFYEDIKKAGLNIYSYKADPQYFKHYEGMSWHKDCGELGLQLMGIKTDLQYKKDTENIVINTYLENREWYTHEK